MRTTTCSSQRGVQLTSPGEDRAIRKPVPAGSGCFSREQERWREAAPLTVDFDFDPFTRSQAHTVVGGTRADRSTR